MGVRSLRQEEGHSRPRTKLGGAALASLSSTGWEGWRSFRLAFGEGGDRAAGGSWAEGARLTGGEWPGMALAARGGGHFP